MRTAILVILAASISLCSGVASAQTAPARVVDDHVAEVRHVGLHYFGATDLGNAASSTTSTGIALDPLTVYTLGVRYWISPRVGLEAGIGFGIGASQSTQLQGTTTSTASTPPRGALGGVLGVPIALAWSRHLVLAIVPFASYAQALQSYNGSGHGYDDPASLRAGVQLDAEVHLGFLGLPQVALEARLGVQAQVTIETTDNGVGGAGESYARNVTYGVGTTVGEFSLEHVLTSSLAATYYF